MPRASRVSALFALMGLAAWSAQSLLHAGEPVALPEHTPDLENGETMFWVGGCASCHASPASGKCDDPESEDKQVLAGGRCLKSEYGTFYVPNITPDKETGIGGWTDRQFINAMRKGLSPSGEHYYPAFPYTSYQRMRTADLLDLKAFLDTLPAKKSNVPDHQLGISYSFRSTLAVWKWMFLDGRRFEPDPGASDKVNRGAYLVEGPGHCGECHTPRNMLGAKIESGKLSGAPDPEGEGFVPNITPHETGIGDWSETDIATFLETGLTPSFDTVGGSMVSVQESLARIDASDRAAIAAYLKSLPPIPTSVSRTDSGNSGAGGK